MQCRWAVGVVQCGIFFCGAFCKMRSIFSITFRVTRSRAMVKFAPNGVHHGEIWERSCDIHWNLKRSHCEPYKACCAMKKICGSISYPNFLSNFCNCSLCEQSFKLFSCDSEDRTATLSVKNTICTSRFDFCNDGFIIFCRNNYVSCCGVINYRNIAMFLNHWSREDEIEGKNGSIFSFSHNGAASRSFVML